MRVTTGMSQRHVLSDLQRVQERLRTAQNQVSGGKRIDLESGKVTIHRADDATDAATGAPARPSGKPTAGRNDTSKNAGRKAVTGKDTKPGAKSGGAPATPSAAAIRAAKRRGREPR